MELLTSRTVTTCSPDFISSNERINDFDDALLFQALPQHWLINSELRRQNYLRVIYNISTVTRFYINLRSIPFYENKQQIFTQVFARPVNFLNQFRERTLQKMLINVIQNNCDQSYFNQMTFFPAATFRTCPERTEMSAADSENVKCHSLQLH